MLNLLVIMMKINLSKQLDKLKTIDNKKSFYCNNEDKRNKSDC